MYGSTEDEPEQHFIGWLGEVDPDELFASGAAWGIKTAAPGALAARERRARQLASPAPGFTWFTSRTSSV